MRLPDYYQVLQLPELNETLQEDVRVAFQLARFDFHRSKKRDDDKKKLTLAKEAHDHLGRDRKKKEAYDIKYMQLYRTNPFYKPIILKGAAERIRVAKENLRRHEEETQRQEDRVRDEKRQCERKAQLEQMKRELPRLEDKHLTLKDQEDIIWNMLMGGSDTRLLTRHACESGECHEKPSGACEPFGNWYKVHAERVVVGRYIWECRDALGIPESPSTWRHR
jgi:hypothetical protein